MLQTYKPVIYVLKIYFYELAFEILYLLKALKVLSAS